ncbi:MULTISPECIES: hypothetical protein [Paenibacillus]|nr:hypothetical protein [Paenibacillus caseinilyticus]MCZ8522548.1 hypothetical protein [Paenibacillus caseinilyticus]
MMISIALDQFFQLAIRLSAVILPWITLYWWVRLVKAYEKRNRT